MAFKNLPVCVDVNDKIFIMACLEMFIGDLKLVLIYEARCSMAVQDYLHFQNELGGVCSF